MPNVALFVITGVPSLILLTASFAMVSPILQAIIPYRLRGSGSALVTLYIFFIGATGGGLISLLFTDTWGPRVTVIVLTLPSSVIGGWIMYRGAKFLRNDLSLNVQELFEEQEEQRRRSSSKEKIPALHVNNVDFSYGSVQILFDISLEVEKGETLALLGTNGAGKSTLLRVISGLGVPKRGVIRLNGQTITYASPERRAKLGIQQLPGGNGIFSDMTVHQNLVMGAFIHKANKEDVQQRINNVFELFPELKNLKKQKAGSLSGGQQQLSLIHI